MMKYLLIPILLLSPGMAHAQAAFNTTCKSVSISSYSSTSIPTELTNNISTNPATNTPASVWAVKVTNLDTIADLFCSQSISVSTITANSLRGDQVPHGSGPPFNWLSWVINQSKDWYCTNNAAAPTQAEVCLTQ